MASEKTHLSTGTAKELVISQESVPEDTIIWRYVKFGRFTDIIKTHGLWFSRPFAFDDRWEGLFPPSYVRRTRLYTDANGISYTEFDEEFRKRMLRHRYAQFVNCWHMNDNESDAMWKLYGKAGIAI